VYLLRVGKLAKGLVSWVRAMNMPEGGERDAAVLAAFNSMTAGFAERKTWDKSDRFAGEILDAFDRSRLDEEP
jgi:hypothetical protein